MNLVIQKSGNFKYVSFRESYWDPVKKKYSSRTVKNFGRLDLLEQENPNILEELRAQVATHKEDLSEQKRKELKRRVSQVLTNQASSPDTYADNRIVNLGSCVYRQIWNKLNLSRKLRDMTRTSHSRFDFANAVFYMSAARSLMPDSKLAQWNRRNQFLYNAGELSLNHLYRAIDMLIDKKDDLIAYLNRQIDKEYNRVITAALYDVTTYYFESQDADELRNFGFSKDNKVNQVQVVMGLLIDNHGIPVDYELFPGNTSEFSTMVPILQKLRDRYGVKRIVVTADRGLNSGSNLLAIKAMGLDYVIAYRLRTAGKPIQDLIEKQEGWISRHPNNLCVHDVSRYRITTETRSVSIVKDDGTRTTEKVTSNLLLNYSATRARKDAHDRDRLISKAQRLADQPSLLKSEMRKGGKSYLKVESGLMDVVLDTEKIEKAKLFDGYYGIVYSDSNMTPDEVLATHHSLWQIEESFRISKSLLQARPCFHWKDRRIKGHFFICYLALVLHRLLELELQQQSLSYTADQIVDALRSATLQEVILTQSEAVYCKSNTEGAFEAIAKAVGLGKLPRLAKAAEVKRAMKLKNL